MMALVPKSDVFLHRSGAKWTYKVFVLVALWMLENKNITHIHTTDVEYK